MEQWKRLEIFTRQQIVLLRQNSDEINTSELLKNLIPEIKAVLEEAGEKENTSWPMEECLRRLRDLTEAYASQDIFFLADVLEYEILDLICYIEENSK